jgi:predicted extracellular nuclease
VSSRALLVLSSVLAVAGLANAQTSRTCAVQGSGPTPPSLGARVSVGGVVTATYRAGFFLQDPNCDADATTSDALWVDGRGSVPPPPIGNRALVTGRVANDGGLTTILAESVSDEGRYAGSVEAVRLNPPADPAGAATYLESHEGMLVSLGASRVVAATDETGVAYVMPDASGVTRLYATDADGRKIGLSLPDGWFSANQNDRLADAAGGLAETPDGFAVWMRSGRVPAVEPGRGAPAAAAPVPSGQVGLGTYNLDALFDGADDPGTDDASSPAGYPAELAVRARSIARYAGAPDVLAVQEVESLGALQDLAAQPELIAAGYRAVLVDGADPRGLDVGLLYRESRFTLRAFEARPAAGVAARAPLVVQLQANASGERLTLIACDFETAASGPEAAAVRLALSDHVRALVEEVLFADAGSGVAVVGHLVDAEDSAPLQRLMAGLLQNLGGRLPAERPYTAVTGGVSVPADYVLVDAALAGRVTESRALHVNVDWAHPATGADPAASPRASDHDPVVVRLRMP